MSKVFILEDNVVTCSGCGVLYRKNLRKCPMCNTKTKRCVDCKGVKFAAVWTDDGDVSGWICQSCQRVHLEERIETNVRK